MELGCAPVVLADRWIPVDGVDWSFCLFVKESQFANLDSIVRSHSGEWKERGAAARQAFEENFSPETLGSHLERQTRRLLETRNEAREELVRMLYPVHAAIARSQRKARMALRGLILLGYRSLGRRFPYEINR
jgi:hypothetical protein